MVCCFYPIKFYNKYPVSKPYHLNYFIYLSMVSSVLNQGCYYDYISVKTKPRQRPNSLPLWTSLVIKTKILHTRAGSLLSFEHPYYHGDCDCVLFQDMDRKRFAVNGVCRQFTQDKVSTLHLTKGILNSKRTVCISYFLPNFRVETNESLQYKNFTNKLLSNSKKAETPSWAWFLTSFKHP